MGDDTRPPGIRLVPQELRERVAELTVEAEEILVDLRRFEEAVDEVATAVESCLRSLDDHDHWAAAAAVGLTRILSLLDRFPGGGDSLEF